MAFKRAKILILIFICIFVFYFTTDFSLINIEKTALIVSLGLDKDENGYEVTAQIAIPEVSNSQATNKESVISANGATLYEAVTKIGSLTGWYPKLSFCNLIILGESLLTENVMSIVDFFVRSYKVEDSAILCCVEGLAKDVLLSSSPLDNISGLSLSKIFVRDYTGASRIMTTSIKQFSIGYYSKSGSGYMPMVKLVPTDESGKGGKSAPTMSKTDPNGGGGGKSGGSSSGSSGGEQQLVIYDANTTLLFNKGYKTGTINGDEALCYSLLYKGVTEAVFTIPSIDNDGKETTISISIHKVKNNLTLDYSGDTPILKGEIKAWLKVSDVTTSESIDALSTLGKLNNKILHDSEEFIKENLLNVFDKTKSLNVDIFEVKNLLYRFQNKYYDRDNFSILDKIQADFDIKCVNFI